MVSAVLERLPINSPNLLLPNEGTSITRRRFATLLVTSSEAASSTKLKVIQTQLNHIRQLKSSVAEGHRLDIYSVEWAGLSFAALQ